jgi:transcriptional regulator with XRE-family HTH domain
MRKTSEQGYTIRPRQRAWASLRANTGLDTYARLAAQLGLTEKTVANVLLGRTDPSPKFIAHTLTAFPFTGFRELFAIAAAGTPDPQ